MGKAKALVRVRVFKEFDYPKSMLHRTNFLTDARNKAIADMQVMVNEIVNNDHATLDANIFQYEAIEEVGYKFRNRQLPEDSGDKISLYKAAKVLTTNKMEAKYGQLNHEITPDLYEHEPEVRDTEGRLVREESWYMRADIEREFYNEHDAFIQLLKNTK